jgi:hypothetical protein
LQVGNASRKSVNPVVGADCEWLRGAGDQRGRFQPLAGGAIGKGGDDIGQRCRPSASSKRKLLDYAGRAGIAFAASGSRLNQFICERDK